MSADVIRLLMLMCLSLMALGACTEGGTGFALSPAEEKKAVYVLVDTSGTYRKQFDQVQLVLRYLLKTLQSGDSLALARIDSISFSEKDIIARMDFDKRPSMANSQKRAFLEMIDNFSRDVRIRKRTDIIGGALQAIEYLNETGIENKYIVIFSDLKEETRQDHVRDFPVNFNGTNVITFDASKLEKFRSKPSRYKKRLSYWQDKVETGEGQWKLVNDLSTLDVLLE